MITIVSPWYGADTRGGAETQARDLAQALRDVGASVRVWASTGRDSFHPGADAYYPPGADGLDGVPIWRFRPTPADDRGVPFFFREHPELLPPIECFPEHELRLLGSLLGSDELYAAILDDRERTRFIFLPYPFPTTFWGALIAPERSTLLACLHDEPYARYSTYHYMFNQVQGVLANSHAEADLARRLYGLTEERVCVAGEGIDLSPRGCGSAFRERYGLTATADRREPALLVYAGRRDSMKNIPLLLAYFREYWARRGDVARLVMMGQGRPDVRFTLLDVGVYAHEPLMAHTTPPAPVMDLGFVDEQAKYDAYAAASVFVQPSVYESFSRVLMEAWLQGAPALVHADCAVTADHVRRSGGGLTFGSFGEFAAALDLLLARADMRRTLGERGRAYVLETCRWDAVARRTAGFALRAECQTGREQ